MLFHENYKARIRVDCMFSIFYLSSLYKGLDIKILLPEGAGLKVLGSMKNIDSNKGV